MRLSNKLFRNIFHRQTFASSTLTYPSKAHSKLVVSRQIQNPFAIFIQNHQTIEQFHQRLTKIFPSRNFFISADEGMFKIGDTPNKSLIKENYEKIKDVYVMDALILNRFNVYEEGENGNIGLRYGVSIMEYNETNNLNIPEHIQEGVNELNNDWKSAKTVNDAVSFTSIPSLQEEKEGKNKGHQNLTSEQITSLNESLSTLIKLEEFRKLQGLTLKPSSQLMYKILGLMSIQWVALFAITYGKYGWDVGQPIAYLSALGVDLVAMLGVFEVESALKQKIKQDHHAMSSVMNFPLMYKMAQWRIAYLLRKTAP